MGRPVASRESADSEQCAQKPAEILFLLPLVLGKPGVAPMGDSLGLLACWPHLDICACLFFVCSFIYSTNTYVSISGVLSTA